ncbi:hypothetical protein NIES267_64270 [Calothrix parasitica NIES-267]|uniref:Uncharacterized protein n=1 Tax=Calothrix parasitica NIES-267 TaxID=1973488 RepID=A0A1Z4M0D0_9CYAN|nr:hypothetical protein NIES267_64270 [Calothrix parasitica NIES-267]
MFSLDRVKTLAQSYSPQEMFAALLWQRRFNLFNGEEVIADLYNNQELWESFVFCKPVYAPDEDGLSFNGLIDILLALANSRPVAETNIIKFIAYPADTLYVLAENQDTTVSQLVELGKKWRADDVYIDDKNNEEYDWKLKSLLRLKLEGGIHDKKVKQRKDAVVICYWWD